MSAIKIGMLYSREIIEVVKEAVKELDVPIVLDPVFISKTGSSLLKEDVVDAMKELFEYAVVITPNRHEAEILFGYKFGDSSSLDIIMQAPTAVLIKNHIMEINSEKITLDQLFFGHQKRVFQTPYINSTNLHGTGCSYSSAIAANLALGYSLEESIQTAKEFINTALTYAPSIGEGAGPINHKAGGEKVLL